MHTSGLGTVRRASHPIALLDFLGLDVCVAIGDALKGAVPERICTLVLGGATSKKVKRGNYSSSHICREF